MKSVFSSFFAAAGYNFTQCPLPAGTYHVRDWPVNVYFDNMPTFIYGSYKMIGAFYKNDKKIGCVIVHCDFEPKDSKAEG